MELFGFCVNGSVAFVRDDGEVFLAFDKQVPDGVVADLEAVRAARPIYAFGRNLSADMGRAINGAVAQQIKCLAGLRKLNVYRSNVYD